MFGRMMNACWGKVHFFLTFIFYNLVFFPMHNLGLKGHMRRIYDPTQYEFLQAAAADEHVHLDFRVPAVRRAADLRGELLVELFKGTKAPENPWEANGLEWTVPSPPPHGNFVERAARSTAARTSTARRSSTEDFLPQNRELPEAAASTDRHS